jgi:hypothetical protein
MEKLREKCGLILLIVALITMGSSCEKDEDSTTVKEKTENLPDISGYPIVGTDQTTFYNNSIEISAPSSGNTFYGQDAQYTGNTPQYVDNDDGTVTDMITGLMWSQTTDLNGDGNIDASDKLTYEEALNGASSFNLAGYDDWRLPTIKELYSLILFSGKDPSGYEGSSTSGLVPFINTDYFDFAYGDTEAGERIIDAQYASSTKYVDYTMQKDETLFGVNFADGRIKGYGLSLFGKGKTFFVAYVRGNTTYGENNFTDNGDGTITNNATGLMWMQNDNGKGVLWEEALSYAENLEFAGYTDWRLPDIKELQSIVDYSRSPSTTSSAAIDPLFNCTQITNEAGKADYPYYWSGTTHANWTTNYVGGNAAYISFGRAMGYMEAFGGWVDVHGAGAQRSDSKTGNPDDYPQGHGPQGDAVRIYNYVRCVRNAN